MLERCGTRGLFLSVAWFRRRLAGLGLLFERLAEYAHRTEFHCLQKTIPQLGQTRLSSVFIGLSPLRMQIGRR